MTNIEHDAQRLVSDTLRKARRDMLPKCGNPECKNKTAGRSPYCCGYCNRRAHYLRTKERHPKRVRYTEKRVSWKQIEANIDRIVARDRDPEHVNDVVWKESHLIRHTARSGHVVS